MIQIRVLFGHDEQIPGLKKITLILFRPFHHPHVWASHPCFPGAFVLPHRVPASSVTSVHPPIAPLLSP